MRLAFVRILAVAMAAPAAMAAPGDALVDTRLANLFESAVVKTNIARINVVSTDTTSLQVNEIDGISVCADGAKDLVLKLQDAFEANPDLYRTYSIFRVTVRKPDGEIVRSTYAAMKESRIAKGDCINLYLSVRPA